LRWPREPWCRTISRVYYISAAPKNCFVAGLNARALHIAELSGKSNRQLGKYPARSAARRTARPCAHVRAHTIRVYSCLVLLLHALLVISAAAKCHRSKYRHWCGEIHIFLLANSSGNGKSIGRPIIADATGQGGNPARDASRLPKDFSNGLTAIARIAARYQTVTETQSPAATENKISQSRLFRCVSGRAEITTNLNISSPSNNGLPNANR